MGLCLAYIRVYDLMTTSCVHWCGGFDYLAKVIKGVQFKDGIEVTSNEQLPLDSSNSIDEPCPTT